jgi:hypothetical protein
MGTNNQKLSAIQRLNMPESIDVSVQSVRKFMADIISACS